MCSKNKDITLDDVQIFIYGFYVSLNTSICYYNILHLKKWLDPKTSPFEFRIVIKEFKQKVNDFLVSLKEKLMI